MLWCMLKFWVWNWDLYWVEKWNGPAQHLTSMAPWNVTNICWKILAGYQGKKTQETAQINQERLYDWCKMYKLPSFHRLSISLLTHFTPFCGLWFERFAPFKGMAFCISAWWCQCFPVLTRSLWRHVTQLVCCWKVFFCWKARIWWVSEEVQRGRDAGE